MTRDLTALTYRSQQRRLRQVAQTALTSYGLANARLVLVKYEDSAVYRVTDTKDNQYALRMMVTADAEKPELLSQMLWLTGLRHDTELLVPKPIPALNGALVLSLSVTGVTRAQCCLLRWVPGRPIIKDPNPEKLVLAGTIAAQLQEHARHWTPPPDFVRPHWDLDWLLSSSSVLSAPEKLAAFSKRGRAVIREASTRIRREVVVLGQKADTFGLIHADLNLGNFAVQGACMGVIDFDDCGWGYYPYDLAVMLCSLRHVVVDPVRQTQLAEAYLAGYAHIRALPDQFVRMLPTFMAFRELAITAFILESTNLRVGQWKQARIETAIERLDAYLRDGALLV